MLAGKGVSTNYIYNGITSEVNIEKILITQSSSTKKMLKRRIKRLGFLTVFNQLIFQVFITRTIKVFSKNLYKKRIKDLKLNSNPLPKEKIIEVGLVNSELTKKTIKNLDPDVIIVNGTAIIGKKILECTNALFINTHVGITPQYRGVHGGYWALRKNDKENFGVTVHKIDKGIDTGEIIGQATTSIKKNDNFLTYPLYQYALALPLLTKTIQDIKEEKFISYKKEDAKSHLYYHPTFTQYLYGWIKYGIK